MPFGPLAPLAVQVMDVGRRLAAPRLVLTERMGGQVGDSEGAPLVAVPRSAADGPLSRRRCLVQRLPWVAGLAHWEQRRTIAIGPSGQARRA